MSQGEFIALMAMLFATIAFSIDSMLPALPRIAEELSPDLPNRAQLILSSFVIGMGVGTFFTGPLSDAFGRKPVLLAGSALYIVGAVLAWAAPSLEMILLARVLQGLGASGPRIVAMAIVRDIYAGRSMARIMSFVMLVFTLVPAVAPLIGSGIIALAGWRAVFVGFVIFALISSVWLGLRQPESLAPEDRRPLRIRLMLAAVVEMFAHRAVRISILAQTLCYVILFLTINMVQPIFDVVFMRADSFPRWFAGMALVSGSASVLNAVLVMRLGMRRLASVAFGAQMVLAAGMSALWLAGLRGDGFFAAYVIWQTTVFFQLGMTIGNLNAIAMEPMGHIAGMAASVIGAVSTIAGALIAVPVGLAFDGTPLPLTMGVCLASAGAYLLLLRLRKIEQAEGASLGVN